MKNLINFYFLFILRPSKFAQKESKSKPDSIESISKSKLDSTDSISKSKLDSIAKQPNFQAQQFSDCAEFFKCVSSVLEGQICLDEVISAAKAAESSNGNEKPNQMNPEKIREIWPNTWSSSKNFDSSTKNFESSSRPHSFWPSDRLDAIPNDHGSHFTIITSFNPTLYPPGIFPPVERMDDSRFYTQQKSSRRTPKKRERWENFYVSPSNRKSFESERKSWTVSESEQEGITPVTEDSKRHLRPFYDVYTEKSGFAISLRDLMAPDYRLLIMRY